MRGCAAPARGVCEGCATAAFCGPEHQKLAWKASHKLSCKLTTTAVAVPGWGGTLTFLGQAAEVKDLPRVGTAAALAAAKPRPGWRALPANVRLGDGATAAGGPSDAYYGLAGGAEADFASVAAAYASPALVVPRAKALLQLDYCLDTAPVFLLTAPPGAKGLAVADVVAAAAHAYGWAYAKEDELAPPFARYNGFMLNRQASRGPFCVSMHDLGDLVLHTLHVRGAAPAGGASAGADEDDVSAIISLGIDS